jgi:hypothetical protein
MPLLGYNGGLPLDFWDIVQSLFNAMNTFILYLTAFLATGPSFRGAPLGVQVASTQYLLGLG